MYGRHADVGGLGLATDSKDARRVDRVILRLLEVREREPTRSLHRKRRFVARRDAFRPPTERRAFLGARSGGAGCRARGSRVICG